MGDCKLTAIEIWMMSNRRAMKKRRRVEEFGWEDLPSDILGNIFDRIDHGKSLFNSAYAVCRSWRSISRLRVFFKQEDMSLDFFTTFKYIYGGEEEANRFMRLLQSVLEDLSDTSKSSIARLDLPEYVHLSDSHLCYLAQQLPNLRILRLPSTTDMVTAVGFSNAIQCWKELRLLWTGPIETHPKPNYMHVIRELGTNCKDLEFLSLSGSELDLDVTLDLDEHVSQQIIHYLPNLRTLLLRDCVLYQQGLENVMNKCAGLEFINVVTCKHAHSSRLSPQSHGYASYILHKLDSPIRWSISLDPSHLSYLPASDLLAQLLW